VSLIAVLPLDAFVTWIGKVSYVRIQEKFFQVHCTIGEYKNRPSMTLPKANILDPKKTMDIELDHATTIAK
jgi:hypothetical protein